MPGRRAGICFQLSSGSQEYRCVTERGFLDHNHRRRHSDLDYGTPATLAANCVLQDSATLILQDTDP